jgi:oligopeptide transport system ATP-binding protein
MSDMLELRGVSKYFPVRGGIFQREVGRVYAVDDVSFSVREGETLGIVGESGCGKSTLARTIVRLYEPSAGQIIFDGEDFGALDRKALKQKRRDMQMIFQDPFASLNPRLSVGRILEEPYVLHHIGGAADRRERVLALLEKVGLRPDVAHRYPHELSGGQRQRIGIARALALEPKFIVCDEAVSALDVSIQSQVLNLLVDLQREMRLTYIFISHDLTVVKYMSDRIAVMYLGRVVELASRDALHERPSHPYTRALLASIPEREPGHGILQPIEGDVPSPANPPKGCHFHPRCPIAEARCRDEAPVLTPMPGDAEHHVACHLAGDAPEENDT